MNCRTFNLGLSLWKSSLFKSVLFLFLKALPLQCLLCLCSARTVHLVCCRWTKLLKLRGLIRIKPEIPEANTKSMGQQKYSEKLSFVARKSSHIFYFSTFRILQVIMSLPGKVKKETIYKHFCCFYS